MAINFTNEPSSAEFKVCKQAAANSTQLIGDSFSFSVNGGTPFSVAAGAFGDATCSNPITGYTAGTAITVQEVSAPAGVYVSNISAPTGASINLGAGTVSWTLSAGLHEVTYTNAVEVTPLVGNLKICQEPSDDFVSGYFSFSVVDSSGASHGPYSVLTGQCTDPISLPAGEATITEASKSPYYLDGVHLEYGSAGTLGPVNLTNQTAVVSIVATTNPEIITLAAFVNDTTFGVLEVCKELAPNSAALTGSTFWFDISADLASTTGGTWSDDTSVVADTPGQSACTNPDAIFLPVGTTVSVTEESMPYVLNESGTQNLTISAGDNTATFTNEAEGTLEICKAANGPTHTFDFLVDGSIPVSITTSNDERCSLPLTVPAGPNTVQELSTANFHLDFWVVSPSSDYISGAGTATATVNVTNPGGTGQRDAGHLPQLGEHRPVQDLQDQRQ